MGVRSMIYVLSPCKKNIEGHLFPATKLSLIDTHTALATALQPERKSCPAPAQSTQVAQVEDPVASAYLPLGHPVHAADESAHAALLYMPWGQATHPLLPVVSALYAPAAHAVQTPDTLAATTLL